MAKKVIGRKPVYKQIEELTGQSWADIKRNDPDYDGTYEGNMRLLDKYSKEETVSSTPEHLVRAYLNNVEDPRRKYIGAVGKDINDLTEKVYGLKDGDNLFGGLQYNREGCWFNDKEGKWECLGLANRLRDSLFPKVYGNKILTPNQFNQLLNPNDPMHYTNDIRYNAIDSRDIPKAVTKYVPHRLISKGRDWDKFNMVNTKNNLYRVGDNVIQGTSEDTPNHTKVILGFNTAGQPIYGDNGSVTDFNSFYDLGYHWLIAGNNGDRDNSNLSFPEMVNKLELYNKPNNENYIKDFENLPLGGAETR